MFLVFFFFGCTLNREPRQTLPVDAEAASLATDRQTLAAAFDALPPAEASTGGPDVVIIVLDTLRADRLTDYGAPDVLMPRLEAFADAARVYPKMRSTAPWTLPSHASMFTAHYAIQHGAHGTPPGTEGVAFGLSPQHPTLAERLKTAGYRSAGIAANRGFLGEEWGLSRGFDVWLCDELAPDWNLTYPQAERITALGLDAYQRLAKENGPSLLFLNYMDPHTPWAPREGYTAAPEQIVPATLPPLKPWGQQGSRWHRIRRKVLGGKRAARPEEVASWTEAYNAEVRYLDEHLGVLLDGLAAAGHGPDDYTIVLADHGEYLGEHGLLNHSKGLHEEVIRVPLLIQGPGFPPGLDPRPVQSRDVPEMLLDALSLARLQPDADDGSLQVSELYWARHRDLGDPVIGAQFNHIERAFIQDEQKLIVNDDGDIDAFALESDPGEARSVPATGWARGAYTFAYQWVVDQTAKRTASPVTVPIDDAQREKLRQLGYIE
ncbi:MAG: sulfatase [Myxococcota bacterium]